MLIGYARTSSYIQNLELQRSVLKAAGCEKIFEDKTSGARSQCHNWAKVKERLRKGDTLIVWRLDRLGRSLKHLITTVEELHERGVGFRSLHEKLDTTTSDGRLIFRVFGALAEYERELIRERAMAGLAAARARGRKGGRPRKLSDDQTETARRLLEDPFRQVSEVAQMFGVARSTLYNALNREPIRAEEDK